eukprot:TRINITY_DN11884_c0_g1_i1.p1 TRINITY_DN11884_c0_g1~~TRINITY_DN11884_c0_g1_i1.p1  ORF type:complete len:177 (-),score=71.36 TRINITY_DN11884_c0_g1_i1:10-507(-)
MSAEQLKPFAGVWKRTNVDANYDAFLAAQGQGWLARKAAAVAPFTKTLTVSASEANRFDDHTSIAGLLNVSVSYLIHGSEAEARAARERKEVAVEEAMGKKSELVAWWNEETSQIVLNRVFATEGYQGFYRHSLRSETVLQLDLEIARLDGSSSVISQELFQRQP